MNNILKQHQPFVLTFIDQQTIQYLNKRKQIFIPEIIKDQTHIDFTSMFERQWDIEADQIIFNSQTKLQNQKAKKIEQTVANFNIEAKNAVFLCNSKIWLPKVQTVFQNPIPQQDIDLFLGSQWFQLMIRIFVILYTVGLMLTDYSFRSLNNKLIKESSSSTSSSLSISNIVSLHFQLFSNCAFTLQIILKMFSKHNFFENGWNIVSLIGCIGCWTCIFLDFQQNDESVLFHILCVLKITLGVRIIQMFQFIKNPFQNFISTIPQLTKVFFPYLIFIIMYSVLGLILFSGANQYRCRQTQEPINGSWPSVSEDICGSSAFQCQVGYCGNPYTYGLPYNQTEQFVDANQYGLVSFDNIGNSILIAYHYAYLSNWTALMYKFSKLIHPYMTALYFFTLALFLFFIMSNLNMVTLSKSFIQKQKIKAKYTQKQKQPQQKQQQQINLKSILSSLQFTLYTILDYVDIILIVISSVVILIYYEGITKDIINRLQIVDFIVMVLCFCVVVLRSLILRKNVIINKFIIVDWLIMFIFIIDIIICFVDGHNILNPNTKTITILRSIKIIRIIRILYFSDNWFKFEKTILKIFVQTLYTVKFFLALLLFVILILAFIGQNIFAQRVKFNPQTRIPDLQNGVSYVVNFDSLYKAMVAVIYLLQNQRWTQTMYQYYRAVGNVALIYFICVVFLIHFLLTRLFIAIFLCYFRKNLFDRNQKQQKNTQIVASVHQQNKSQLITQQLKNTQKKYDNIFNISQSLNTKNPIKLQNKNQVTQQNSTQKNTSRQLSKCINRNNCIFQLIRVCYKSQIFRNIIKIFIIIHCFTVILRTNQDNQYKTYILDVIQRISLYWYIFQVVVGIIGLGFYADDRSYLKQSKVNYISIIVGILVVVSELTVIEQMDRRLIRRFTIIKILTFFTRNNKQVSIVLGSISAIAQHFIRMLAIYAFLLIISCTLPLRLQKFLAQCHNFYAINEKPTNYVDCMLMGGDWVNNSQQFNNIFQSIVLMYQIVTSQSWTYFIEMSNRMQPWDVFFVVNFFIYNLCLLNIFVGLNVQTYLTLKQQAYKLNLLRPNQKMWLLIRNSINQLVPKPTMKQPQTRNKFRKIAYYIISQSFYQIFIDILPYINVFIYTLKYYRGDPTYLHTLNIINYTILIIFMCDTVLKLQLHWNFFYLDNAKVQLVGFIYYVLYGLLVVSMDISFENQRILQFIGALFLILRCKKLLIKFTWSKTLLNSVIDILPKCAIIGALLTVILFFYISIGMEIFKYTKPTPFSDGYTTGFNNAFTSLLTLLKIVSNQSWFDQVSAYVRGSSPIDICFNINSMQDALKYQNMGCGSKAGYLYFISFHIIIALLVMNLLIATMVASYDENYEKQYKSVNVFQLQDCLNLWQKYDADGTGVIPYKKFWRLSSQIAILFGISKKRLIKSKQKFLQQLDIPVCQSVEPKNTSVFCYKFHDVLTQFSKIKLKVSKSDNQQDTEFIDFQIHPTIQFQIKDYVTVTPKIYDNIKPYKNFKSAQMKYFFGLLRKMRAWKIVAKKKNSSVVSKLSHIIAAALQRKKSQQKQFQLINSTIQNIKIRR